LAHFQTSQDGLVLPSNFANLNFISFVVFSTQEGSQTARMKIYDSGHLCRASRPTPPPNLAQLETNQDGLVLQPNFVNLIFIAFVVLSTQEGSKIASLKNHDYWHLCWASQSTPPPNLAHFQTNQDGLVLPLKFANLIFITFVVLSTQEG